MAINKAQAKITARRARHARIRARVFGTATRPRLAVFRSNTALYAQLINDTDAVTLVAADTRKDQASTPTKRAIALGQTVAQKAKAAGLSTVVFDRGGFLFAGAIKAFADSARANGLTF